LARIGLFRNFRSGSCHRKGISRLSSKAGVIVELNRFEPGFDVFEGFGMLAHVFGKECKCFRVAARSTFFHEGRPGFDFPRCARYLSVF
jgi:hypothetical protein